MKKVHMQFGNNSTMSLCQTGPCSRSTRRPIVTTEPSKVTCKCCLQQVPAYIATRVYKVFGQTEAK